MNGVVKGGSGVDNGQEGEQDPAVATVVVVGFAFMVKKMQSMAQVVTTSPVDGVEFHPLDFSLRPDQHRRVDVILHKLSEDIMFRDVRPEGDARISWIEAYLSEYPGTVILDPVDKVANCINRITTLELLKEAYRRHGAEGGMPRPPRFVVMEKSESADPGTPGIVPANDLAFPVICKPVGACGTRESHSMVVVLDQAGMAALKPPIVVQECRNHGAKIFKVCVVGDTVRVHERPSLPDLPKGLVGSFSFDSQKQYPTLVEVQAVSAAAMAQTSGHPPPPPPKEKTNLTNRAPGVCDPSPPPSPPDFQGTKDRDDEDEGHHQQQQQDQHQRQHQREETYSWSSSPSPSSSVAATGAGAAAAEAMASSTAVSSSSSSPSAEPTASSPVVETELLLPPPGRAAKAAKTAAEAGASTEAATAAAAAGMATVTPTPTPTPAAPPPTAAAEVAAPAPTTTTAVAPTERRPPPLSSSPAVTMEAAKTAAVRMRETFGLSLFGFDLIIDGATGEALVIDVNYFPSFKDLGDFPQLLRLLLRQVVASPSKK